MRELKSIEEKILDCALYLIGKQGTCNVPIRAIAKEAGVNVSAINYYFRTKEEMLRNTKEFFINNSIEIYSILDQEEYSEEERLILFANEIMEYTIHYSGLSAIFKEAERLKEEDEISKTIIEVTKELHTKMDRILSSVAKSGPSMSQYNSMIFMAALTYPAEKQDTFGNDQSLLTSKEKRLEYIKHIINLIKK
ncbi:transcriptional regulator, TetR family [Anaerosporobacter mobilis DSM 15930]|uniref:Transcriptional regulator, TetR family n=1 Tax=Anaerosporobacter mobilis DSM 15930 TaxID=1120996 RepID=A0A1M7KP57_9FIRM|nr:TetR/AcrR family transcriptional regulator [Anaerosporobacter mobilis]SHM67274.1 transcriptional regulator, TetR family [Anaerosporobacter mobilis DSM 15930]